MFNSRPRLVAWSCMLLALLTLLAGLKIGALPLSWQAFGNALVDSDSLAGRIVWQLRMPRTLLAFLAGSGLALAGQILQTVTRNPLADPYLFGISSGASFGVVLLLVLGGGASAFGLPVAAFGGSLLAILMLLMIAGKRVSMQVETLLLAGVALSFFFSALTSLLLYHSDPQAVTAILFWTLGSFSRASWHDLALAAPVVMLGLGWMLLQRRRLNALLLGDEAATTLGVPVAAFRVRMLVLSSLLTAVLVAVCGGIGFVGLMIPHLVRFFVSQGAASGPVVTALTGGLFMVWVDILARSLFNNQELPVGVITAMLGSLFFLLLLYWRRRAGEVR